MSPPCGPTRSFPWTTYPDLLLNSTLSLSHFLSNIVVISLPPGPLGNFSDEMDALLSCCPDDGTSLVVLGDFNTPPEKLHSPELIDFFSTSDLTLSPSPLTHRAGNQLNLVLTRSCRTSVLSVTLLTVSDHHAVTFTLPLKLSTSLSQTSQGHQLSQPEPPLSPLLFCPHIIHRFTEEASSTLLSSLSSSEDTLCPLTSRPADHLSSHRLSESLRTNRSELRAAEDHPDVHHLLSDFSSTLSAAKSVLSI